jgi:hypothetical protein
MATQAQAQTPSRTQLNASALDNSQIHHMDIDNLQGHVCDLQNTTIHAQLNNEHDTAARNDKLLKEAKLKEFEAAKQELIAI